MKDVKEDQLRRREYEAELGLRPEFELPNPGIGWTWLITLLVKALKVLMPIITPVIREELEKFLLEWYAKTLETPNPWDDFVARFLLRIFDIPVPEKA